MKRPLKLSDLSADSREFFNRTAAEYSISDSPGERTLFEAAKCLDHMRNAEKILDMEGYVIKDKWEQVRSHPAVRILNDARSGFIAAMRLLSLDFTGESKHA